MDAKAAAQDAILPFKVLVSPFKTFSQLAQGSHIVGLVTVLALTLGAIATALYASATRIFIQIGEQSSSLLASPFFGGWFTNMLIVIFVSFFVYWGSLVMLSMAFVHKQSWRVMLVSAGYVLSVFMVLYAVRAAVYVALPAIPFGINYWPPNTTDFNNAQQLMVDRWGSLYQYQFAGAFTFVAVAWLIALGAISIKTLGETSWTKAAALSIAGFMVLLIIFGLP